MATIRPAYDRLLRFGRQVWCLRQKMLGDVMKREREGAQNAKILDAAYRRAGRESPVETRELSAAQKPRDRRLKPSQH